VGGLTLAATAPVATRALVPTGALQAFLVSRGADIRLGLSHEAPPVPARADLLFQSGGVWSVHRHDGGLLYSFRSRAASPPVYKAVAIDAELTRGTLYFPRHRGGPHSALDFPLDELLFQHRLAREGALEVHACGVVHRGRTLVFCGVSGSGKSTTARLWTEHEPAATTLSDDRLVLRRRGTRYWAYGTPWHGDGGFASPRSRPIAAIFFLSHARRSEVRRLGTGEAAARLFARSFPPPWDEAVVARCLETADGIVGRVPCFDLRFRPDASAIAAVKAATSEASG
jgi:hypothetical protein